MVIPLCRIDAGECGKVVWIASGPHTTARLEDLGFVSDASVECVVKGTSHSMSAYWVNHSLVGLRREMAEEIFVRK